MPDNSPSHFEELREEMRTSQVYDRFERNSKRWMLAIYGLLASHLLLLILLPTFYGGPIIFSANWFFNIFYKWLIPVLIVGAACGVLAYFTAMIPFKKDWEWEWRFKRLRQVFFGTFLLIVLADNILTMLGFYQNF